MCPEPAHRGATGLCLLEELVSTGWHEAWDLPARRGQGGRERTGVPGHDWAGNGHTKVPVGKVSATGPVTNISKRLCWGFLCVLKKISKNLSLSLSSHVKGPEYWDREAGNLVFLWDRCKAMRSFPWPFLVPRFPPALVRGRLLSQMSSNFFFPFHIIKYKQMTEKVRWWEAGGVQLAQSCRDRRFLPEMLRWL